MNDESKKKPKPEDGRPPGKEDQAGGEGSPEGTPAARRPSGPAIWLILILVMLGVMMLFRGSGAERDEVKYSFFEDQLAADNIASVEIRGLDVNGAFRHRPLKPTEGEEAESKAPEATSDPQDETSQPSKDAKGDAKPSDTEKKSADEKTPSNDKPGKDSARKSDDKVNRKGEQADSATENADDEEKRYSIDFFTRLPPIIDEGLTQRLRDKKVEVTAKAQSDPGTWLLIVYLGVTVLIILFFWMMYRRTRDQLMGGGLFSGIIKSPAKRYDNKKQPVTFEDVAGLEGVKQDLQEVVEFLKSPEKFQRLGGQVPKGVLLMGPPGTGKTLLARAVAGEADVPFFSINGSEFIQMFVGVGASRVRDMFKQAKEASPAILFVDEIDAVGRQRGAGLGGGHDEREQTLNQILSEMDGFDQSSSVIVLAATNRPDVLDPALLRPGRFDRHIAVDRPTQKGRKAIFEVHTREVPVADDVDFDRLAAGSIGLTGADIRNLVNEAALWATRQGKNFVDMSDFEFARDKVLMGAKREELLSEHEKELTAYHEAGHALLAWMVSGVDRVHKVTIIPRGRALGVTQLLPSEERMNISENELHARLVFMLGGRGAEKLIFDEYSAGAENDLKEATQIARRMVTRWGMSERLGPVAFNVAEDHPFLGREIAQEHREFSEHTAQVIDEEIARILHGAAERATKLLTQHRELLGKLAQALIEREILDEREIEELIGPAVRRRFESNGRPTDELESPSRSDA